MRATAVQRMLRPNIQRAPPAKETSRSAYLSFFRWNDRSADLRRSAQVLREERERAAPGQIGRGLVVARAAGVVGEGVLGARIDVLGILLVVGLERSLEVRDALVDVVVVLGVFKSS